MWVKIVGIGISTSVLWTIKYRNKQELKTPPLGIYALGLFVFM